jgi:alkylation response protein AidB-like acyl-CoA dehydrogenase
MRDWNALSEDSFRAEIRSFFERHYPPDRRFPPYRYRWSQIKGWYQTLYAHGMIAPGWPTAYGGMGLSPAKLIIFIEEQEQYGVARVPDLGLVMVGPLLIQEGNDRQRHEYLPKILSGENIWCQGYSEPNAGSDLASLRTSAVLEGDDFVVNGQKIWTSFAQDATHMFLLVRTIVDLITDIARSGGGNAGAVTFGEESIEFLSQFYAARPVTIYGGSSEIQRSIIAKSVLDLPG